MANNKTDPKWYVLQSVAGQEKKALTLLEEGLRNKKLENLVLETFVPAETVTMKRGKKQTTKAVNYFPGYILIKMILTDELWHLLKNTTKISGFIGNNQREPKTVPESEIEIIRQQIKEGAKQSQINSSYQLGETVTIVEGPFMDFKGVIDNIDIEKNKLTVIVSIFGRTTPLELELDKVKSVEN